MKNLMFIMLTFVMVSFFTVESNAQSHGSEKIGEVSNGRATLTANVGNIKANWANVLATESGLQVTFTDVQIVEANSNYYLIAQGSDTVSKLSLVNDGGDLYVAISAAGTGISCTSKSCSQTSGCVPSWSGTKCTECTGDCSKTVSSMFAGLNKTQ